MTQKEPTKSAEEEMKALEIENASYIDVEEPVEVQEESPAEPEEQPPEKKAKTGILWLFTIINFLLVIAAIAAGYWFWMQWQGQLNTENSEIQDQQSVLTEQTVKIQSLDNALAEQQRTIQQTMDSLNQQIAIAKQQSAIAAEQSEANRKNLDDVSGRRPADWLLAEADYLVRMAGRKLWLEGDVQTAIAMLQAADSRIQDLADPSLLPVRQFIASDIQTLQQVNQVSLTAIALSVSGMVQQVSNLPLALPEADSDNAAPQELEGLDRIWAYILSNFKYQANNTPIKPLLSAQQQWLAREQLRFALLQAQSAVTREQDTLFKQSVQRSIGLLIEHFDLDAPEVEQFVTALQNLEKSSIERNYPQQLDSTRPLQDVLERRMSKTFSNGNFDL